MSAAVERAAPVSGVQVWGVPSRTDAIQHRRRVCSPQASVVDLFPSGGVGVGSGGYVEGLRGLVAAFSFFYFETLSDEIIWTFSRVFVWKQGILSLEKMHDPNKVMREA